MKWVGSSERREKKEKAGKKDKGRSDEGTYPILAGVAAGYRVQEGFEGSLIGSLQRDRLGERTRNRVNMGSIGLKCRRRRKRTLLSLGKGVLALLFVYHGPFIKCAFMRMIFRVDIVWHKNFYHLVFYIPRFYYFTVNITFIFSENFHAYVFSFEKFLLKIN